MNVFFTLTMVIFSWMPTYDKVYQIVRYKNICGVLSDNHTSIKLFFKWIYRENMLAKLFL